MLQQNDKVRNNVMAGGNLGDKVGDRTYIYIWYPTRDLPQSILIYCLYVCIYIYIYKIYTYLCAYMYKSQLFILRCLVGSSCAHYQNKLETKKQYLTTLWERIHGENPKKQKTSRKPTKNNIWKIVGKTLLTKSKKPRENQKNKKTKLFRECLV